MDSGISDGGLTMHLAVPGRCKPNASFVYNKKAGRFFTPKEVTKERNRIRQAFLKAFPRHNPWPKPNGVRAKVLYRFLPEKDSGQKVGDPCTVKIDLDNLMKLLGDSLNGIAYEDDCQICDLKIDKELADKEGMELTLTLLPCEHRTKAPLKRTRIDGDSWKWEDDIGTVGTAYRRAGGYFLIHESGELIGLCNSLKKCRLELEERDRA